MTRINLILCAGLLALQWPAHAGEQQALGPVEQSMFCGEAGREDGATAAYGRAVNDYLTARARAGVGERQALAELKAAMAPCKDTAARAASERDARVTTAQQRP